MATYCTIEESFGGSLLSSGNSLSTGITGITGIKQRKSKSNKQIVPHAFEDSSNSFCALNSDDSDRITTLSSSVPKQPSYYRQGPIEEEREMVPHNIQYNGHNENPDNYYSIVQSERQENYNNVELVKSENNKQTNERNNNVDETLKTILKRLDRLEERLNKQSTNKSNSNIHDIILYVLMGIFLLFILDSVFKIGKLTL